MMQPIGRRKLSNLIVDRRALVRLSIPFLTMSLVSLAIVFAIRWQVMRALEATQLTGLSGPENLAAINTLLGLQRSITTTGAIGVVVLAVLCFGLWLRFSHRIFGPTIPMRRHIQSLSEGDYSSRIELRDADEFKGLAEDLNQLAEILAKGKSR